MMVTTPGILPGVKEVVPMEGNIRARLRKYHEQCRDSAEEFFREQMKFEADESIRLGEEFSPAEFAKRVEEAKLEDGSVYAAFRDKLEFHTKAVEFLS